tara:strand:- start:139 stop:450 length:312 start_codon:yes stop_codon:yes gene_type:complete
MTNLYTKRNPASYFIELSPTIDLKNMWTGEVKVNIISSSNNPMDDKSKESLLHLTELIASTVAYLETNPSLADELEDFIQEPEYTSEENVISINFTTKTKGNA